MFSPDGVLAAIDSALRDYDVSPDAMRWTPDEPDPADTPSPDAQLWGIDINGTRIYRTSSPPWTTFRVPGEAPREPTAPDAPADVVPDFGEAEVRRLVGELGVPYAGPTTVRFVPDMSDLHAPTVAELGGGADLTRHVSDVTFYRDDGYRRAWNSPSRTVLISFDFGDRFTAPVTAILERLAEIPCVSREQLARRTAMKTSYAHRRRNRR